MIKMRFAMKVIRKIIEDLVECKKDCGCVNDPERTCCKVISCVDKKIHFIKYASENYCGYKLSFGVSDICTCPARKELYNRKAI